MFAHCIVDVHTLCYLVTINEKAWEVISNAVCIAAELSDGR